MEGHRDEAAAVGDHAGLDVQTLEREMAERQRHAGRAGRVDVDERTARDLDAARDRSGRRQDAGGPVRVRRQGGRADGRQRAGGRPVLHDGASVERCAD